MTFYEVLEQVTALLRRHGRVSYRALKRQFGLDDAYLDDLRAEIIEVQQLAVDQGGTMLVWTGDGGARQEPSPPQPVYAQQPDRRAESRTPDAERRQLTVLFCDLVDSTRLANQLDPEDYRDVVRAYQTACAEVIQRYRGHIAQYLGDGLLVYFGYPQAHEDEAQRAVRTGLEMVEAIRALQPRLDAQYGIHLAIRVGIHTGVVVVGEMGGGGRQEQLALGDTPNIAARLQGLASPDTVVISAATSRLVEGFFTWQALGAQNLKGVSQPFMVYRVLDASTARTRLDIATPRGLAPLVGRDEEVALVQRRWDQAKTGTGQVVLISGEAGIGKSRLVQVLKDLVAAEPHARIEWRGSPHHQQSALYPIIDHLHRLLQWHAEDSPSEKLHRLEATLAASGMELSEAVPLLAALLSLPLPPSHPPFTLTPQRQRQQTFDTLLAWLRAEAQRWPVLVIVEDLHWIDPSTLELLSLLIDQSAQVRLCLAMTARPEFHPPWTMTSHLTSLTLRRFTPAQVEHLATHVAGDKALPPTVLQEVLRKTDGVPLFVEELMKTVLESGLLREQADHYELSGPLPPLAIPATLHDALMARLDRLAAVKVVAQLGAAIGRTFTYELLQAVAQLDTATLHGALAQLVEAEVVTQRGLPPQATYMFKHALIQDAAYQSLLRSTRQQYHQQIAQVLEARFPDIHETQPELLARHYTEAGLSAQAMPYWQRAGQRALERSGYREAVTCFEQALIVLRRLPEHRDTLEQAIDLHFELRHALLPLGDQAPIFDHLREAETLAQMLNDRQRLGQVSVYMAEYFRVMSDLDHAVESGQRALTFAATLGDVGLQVKANFYLGTVYYDLGDYGRAVEGLRWNVASLEGDLTRERFGMTGLPSVLCRVYLSWSLGELGGFAEATARGEEGVGIAEAADHPFSLIWAYSGIGKLYLDQGDVHRSILVLERGLKLCQTWDIPTLFPQVTRALGTAYALAGRLPEALPLLEQAASQGRRGGHALYFVHLSKAYLLAGRIEDALERAQQALSLAQDYKQRGYQAHALHLLGESAMHHKLPEVEQAEAYYQQALALAGELGMRLLQAHCHYGLGLLYSRTGRAEQARAELSAAIALYRAMDMTFWLPQAEAVLAQVEGR
jgi:class 3 adenylate cyclase/tetratricopeptide (TPR) repeat protein/energy-coupling factor transporter ATP-binding protein EcfA2